MGRAVLLSSLLLACAPAGASTATPSDSSPPLPDAASPRGMLGRFQDLTRRGQSALTLDFLDPLAPAALRTPDTARKLGIVLDEDPRFRSAVATPAPQGSPGDDPDPLLERVSEVGRGREPLVLRKLGPQDGAPWVVSAASLGRVEDWYAGLDTSWLHDHLPDWLTQPGPRGLAWWQWLGMPLLAFLAFLLARPAAWLLLRLAQAITSRTSATWDDELVERGRGPAKFLGAVLVMLALLPVLGLGGDAHAFLSSVLTQAGIPLALAWTALRSVDVLVESARRAPWMDARPEAKALLPLLGRIAKVGLGIAVTMAVLQALGYPVNSIVAGLGIGGLVVALAAQKTMENFFGSVALSVDQPFHPGDFIKIDDVSGTVEFVGLRSTRIRTLDRTLITIPNGKLADLRLENYSVRDRFQLYCALALHMDTRPHQVRAILADLEATLKAHPLLWPDDLTVCLRGIGTSSLDVDVRAWFATRNFTEFLALRQKLLLEFLEIVRKHGSSLAYPTQTVQVAGPPGKG